MKRKYETPMIAVEHYELTQAIAACTRKINFLNSDCVKYDVDSTDQMRDLAWSGYFNAGHCGESAEGMDVVDSICYHTNVGAAFTSG